MNASPTGPPGRPDTGRRHLLHPANQYRPDLLDLPEWARNLSPLHWMGAVPRDDWNQLAALIMTVLAAALVVAATAVYERRDLRAG